LRKTSITVGPTGDLTGSTHVPIQAAIEYVAAMGGGTVHLQAGTYEIGSALHLRSGVQLAGTEGKTVLRKGREIASPLIDSADTHETQVSVANPEWFSPGQTITLRSDRCSAGFQVTTAIITAIEGNVCYLDRAVRQTLLTDESPVMLTNFSVISGYNCQDAAVRHMQIEGNRAVNSFVDGCRNGGIFLFECERITIEDCSVSEYNGDGISYQCCSDIVVQRCQCSHNSGKGIHPGSGTERTVISHCITNDNGLDGIFICWRVRHSIVEHCRSFGNLYSGLSIGHKDTHNMIRHNQFSNNHYYGIFFRNELDPAGANHNKVEHNLIVDNGSDAMGYVGIRIRGFTHDVDIASNRILFETSPQARTIGICIEEHAHDIRLKNNEMVGCAKDIHSHWQLNDHT